MSNSHCIDGPSRHPLRAACPGSRNAELPEWDKPQESRDDATAGNVRHAAACAGLLSAERRPALIADLPADDRPLVEAWWTYWDAKVSGAVSIEAAGAETAVALSDQRHGTTDGWMLWRDQNNARILTVSDLKNQPPGRARWNLQVADYLDGLATQVGGTIDHREVCIVSRAGTDEHRYDRGEHEQRVEQIARILAASHRADAPRIPGNHCTYCLGSSACTARTAVAIQATAITNPIAIIGALEPAQRTDLLDRLSLAADLMEEARDKIKAAIRDGSLEVPGYRLTPTTREAWSDEATARAVLTAKHADKADELTALCSPSQAAKLLGKAALDGLIDRKPGTPSVRRMKGAA